MRRFGISHLGGSIPLDVFDFVEAASGVPPSCWRLRYSLSHWLRSHPAWKAEGLTPTLFRAFTARPRSCPVTKPPHPRRSIHKHSSSEEVMRRFGISLFEGRPLWMYLILLKRSFSGTRRISDFVNPSRGPLKLDQKTAFHWLKVRKLRRTRSVNRAFLISYVLTFGGLWARGIGGTGGTKVIGAPGSRTVGTRFFGGICRPLRDRFPPLRACGEEQACVSGGPFGAASKVALLRPGPSTLRR
jgi:hypothetical protein